MEVKKSRARGLSEGWERYTIIMKPETIERFKNYAYTERLELKKAMEQIITAFLDDYEKNNKIIQRPKED